MVEWRWQPWTSDLSLLPTGDRSSRSGLSAAVLNRLCSSHGRDQRTKVRGLRALYINLGQSLGEANGEANCSPVPFVSLLLHFFFASFVFPQDPRSMAQGGRNSVNIAGQERAQQADTVSRKQHRGGLHSVSLSMLVGFYQLDTNLHMPTKKECQLRSCPHQTEL